MSLPRPREVAAACAKVPVAPENFRFESSYLLSFFWRRWFSPDRAGFGLMSLPRPRVPHISPSFGEMWEVAAAGAKAAVAPENFRIESS
jgi:hypothetical protein